MMTINDFYQTLNAVAQLDGLQRITVSIIPMLFAITLHEAAHAYAAKYFGDTTAHDLGRISLNPLKHIDPIGTVLVPSLTMLVGGIFFGWAKPVPVNFSRLRHPKQDMLWVALAGPAANLAMVFLWTIALHISSMMPDTLKLAFQLMCAAGIITNTVLMVLNLIPIPPFDGGRIMVSLLPMHLAVKYAQVERYGFVILIILLFTHILDKIMWPFVMLTIQAIATLFF